MLVALVLITAYFGVMDGAFVSSRNLSQLAIELASTAVLGLGMLLVILPGHIDLSVGSGLGLAGGLAAVLVVHHGWAAPLALLITTLLTVGVYALMGTIIVRERVPAFIITLGGLLVFKVVHWLVIENKTVPVVEGSGSNLYSILTTYYLPPTLGTVFGVVIVAGLGVAMYNNQRRRQARGFDADLEAAFLKW